jgi:hypothetical protein
MSVRTAREFTPHWACDIPGLPPVLKSDGDICAEAIARETEYLSLDRRIRAGQLLVSLPTHIHHMIWQYTVIPFPCNDLLEYKRYVAYKVAGTSRALHRSFFPFIHSSIRAKADLGLPHLNVKEWLAFCSGFDDLAIDKTITSKLESELSDREERFYRMISKLRLVQVLRLDGAYTKLRLDDTMVRAVFPRVRRLILEATAVEGLVRSYISRADLASPLDLRSVAYLRMSPVTTLEIYYPTGSSTWGAEEGVTFAHILSCGIYPLLAQLREVIYANADETCPTLLPFRAGLHYQLMFSAGTPSVAKARSDSILDSIRGMTPRQFQKHSSSGTSIEFTNVSTGLFDARTVHGISEEREFLEDLREDLLHIMRDLSGEHTKSAWVSVS